MTEMPAVFTRRPESVAAALPGVLPLLLAAAMALSGAARAEQPDAPKKTIAPFGSHMTVQKQDRGVALDGVLKAIGDSKATAENVKILTKLEQAKIVHIGKALDGADQTKVDAAVKGHLDDVKALQLAIEGNALTYAALNAQTVSTSDIVGAQLSGDSHKSITMFARH